LAETLTVGMVEGIRPCRKIAARRPDTITDWCGWTLRQRLFDWTGKSEEL